MDKNKIFKTKEEAEKKLKIGDQYFLEDELLNIEPLEAAENIEKKYKANLETNNKSERNIREKIANVFKKKQI